MIPPQRVPVFDTEYTIMECPHPLRDDATGEEYQCQLDHQDLVIWITPGLGLVDLVRVLPFAVAECWREHHLARTRRRPAPRRWRK